MSDLPKWISEHVPTEVAESTLFKFNIKLLNGNTITVNMLNDLDIDYDILERQLEDIPAQYAFWAAVYSEVRSYVAVYERRIKAKKGRLTETIIEAAKIDKVKLPEKIVASIVEKDESLAKLDMDLASAQMKAGKLYHMLEAIKMKSELTRSLAGFKRQEKSDS